VALLSLLVPDDDDPDEEEAADEDCCRRRRSRRRSALGPTLLVVLILADPDNRSGRDAVRQTWLNFLPNDCRAYFAVGMSSSRCKLTV